MFLIFNLARFRVYPKTGCKYQSLHMKKCFFFFFKAMITWEKDWKYSSMGDGWQLFLALILTCFIFEWNAHNNTVRKTRNTILFEGVCNPLFGKVELYSVILCVNINIKSNCIPSWIVGLQTKDVCCRVFLNSPFRSFFLWSNSGKHQKVFKGVDEKTPAPSS